MISDWYFLIIKKNKRSVVAYLLAKETTNEKARSSLKNVNKYFHCFSFRGVSLSKLQMIALWNNKR